MAAKVYFIKADDNENDESLCRRLEKLVRDENLLGFVADRDFTAVKTHFGESSKLGYIRPVYVGMLGGIIKEAGGLPYLTETSTLYKGNRNNAVKHIAHAHAQGFTFAATGMPIIMADGLFGDEECDVPVDGNIYRSVHIASLFAKCNALVVLSHFTGHMGTGFGATLKNLGMGCSSRKGKMAQHSTAKPKIKKKACTGCGACADWCPEAAISLEDEKAAIDREKCIGCGQCLAMCRFDAVKYNWKATYEDLQKKVVEHAMGVHTLHRDKSLYVNVATRVSKDCDCGGDSFEKIVPDVGIFVSRDPVAVDAASLDGVETSAGKTLGQLAYDVPTRLQLDYARELGFGSLDYELVEF
jgi:uncharacterized Fe-S center protein